MAKKRHDVLEGLQESDSNFGDASHRCCSNLSAVQVCTVKAHQDANVGQWHTDSENISFYETTWDSGVGQLHAGNEDIHQGILAMRTSTRARNSQ
eukprot:scaffold311064_cov22-Tisochrysis_lutea.AAC.1